MDTKGNIYLDYASTTPVDPRVIEAMFPFFTGIFGNPSSVHGFGQAAEAALENARFEIATDLGCRPEEIVFTSGGSESDNLALRGSALAMRKKTGANHLLISPVDHPAILRTGEQLGSEYGFDVEYLPVDSLGMVDPADVSMRIRPTTGVVSAIYANNEIGTINPVAEIGLICRQHEILFHTDAVQAVAHLRINLQDLPIDLLSIGAHKMYGPKGVGSLFIRKGTPILPILTGGKQESNLRAGTQNLPYIIGLAEALHLAQSEVEQNEKHTLPLRDKIIGTILDTIPGSLLTGHPTKRLPNHASFVFEGIEGNELLMVLDLEGFSCSSGSACKTGDPEPSEVLTAIGLNPQQARGSLRITLGLGTTSEQVNLFLEKLPGIIQRCREK
jgi:cysteine desulfurase